MGKRIRIITGIVSFLYFSIPYIVDITDWHPADFIGYALTFIPLWVYNETYTGTTLNHIVTFLALVAGALILWWCLYKITMECYEIYLDIYLDRKRFKQGNQKDQ